MTYAEYRSLVLQNLDVDANRYGTEVLRDRAIQNSMADLQRLIPQLRPVGIYKTSFQNADVLPDGWDEVCAEASAEYTKAKLVHRYDKDRARSQDHQNEYVRLRSHIARELRERTTQAQSITTSLTVRQGKTFLFSFQVSRSLVGAKLWFTVKPNGAIIPDDRSPIYITTEVVDSGLTMVSATEGKFTVSGSADLNPTPSYVWDLEVEFSDGTREVPEGLHGDFIVIPDPAMAPTPEA